MNEMLAEFQRNLIVCGGSERTDDSRIALDRERLDRIK